MINRTLPVIDAHQHNWDLNRFEYAWLKPDAPYYADYLPDDAYAEMQSAGVEYCVLVEAAGTSDEIPWLLALAGQHEHIAGVVGAVDLSAPDAAARLARHARDPNFKGVRINWRTPKKDWRALSDRMGVLANLQLSCDVLLTPDTLPQIIEVIERNEDVWFVLDHFAGAQLVPGGAAKWAGWMRPLADLPNASIKISGYMSDALDVALLRSYIAAAIDLVGAGRLMFGSDWPVTLAASESYYDTFALFAMVVNKLPQRERELISGGTAKRVYRLDV